MTDANRHDAIFEADRELRRYREALANIRHYKQCIDQLQRRMDATAPPLDPDKIFARYSNSSPEDLLLEIIDRQRIYYQMQLDAERLADELEWRLVHWTDGIEQRILRAYYLFGNSIADAARMEGYSWRHLMKIKRRALEHFGAHLLKDDIPCHISEVYDSSV